MTLKGIERQEKVEKLIGRGLSQAEISQTLDVSRATIMRDVRQIKKKILAQIEKKDVADFVMQIELNHVASLRELWKLYLQTKNESVKLGCLKQVNQQLAVTLDMLQKLGILDKAAEKIEQRLKVIWVQDKESMEIKPANNDTGKSDKDKIQPTADAKKIP
jgi:predicted transcriptional regulator